MEIQLGKNICNYRKEKNMTQEELAEALGVTFAAVSKWERGIATPDIDLIIQLANIFDVSLDTLIGFQMKSNDIDTFEEKLEEYFFNEKYDEAIIEAKNKLIKYPNNFRVVYACATLYYFLGFKKEMKEYYKKAIKLYEQSILLLSQNEKTEINEVTIRGEIAQCYIELDEEEKGISILKKYNARGVFNPIIAYTYTSKEKFKPEEVEPFLHNALTSNISAFVMITFAFSNYYKGLKDYEKAVEAIMVLKDSLELLKLDKSKNNYFDKVIAYIYANCSVLYYCNNDIEKTKECLNYAYDTAIMYDQNQVRKTGNLKLFTPNYKEEYMEDSFGKTGIDAVFKAVSKEENVLKLWMEKLGE